MKPKENGKCFFHFVVDEESQITKNVSQKAFSDVCDRDQMRLAVVGFSSSNHSSFTARIKTDYGMIVHNRCSLSTRRKTTRIA